LELWRCAHFNLVQAETHQFCLFECLRESGRDEKAGEDFQQIITQPSFEAMMEVKHLWRMNRRIHDRVVAEFSSDFRIQYPPIRAHGDLCSI
jgi:hypothetical protein